MEGCSGLVKGQMINTASGEIDSWYTPEYANATYKTNDGTEKPWTDVNKRYATVIQRLDAQVGDLLQLLKDLKIDQNTLVVFSSDNGPSQESYLKESYTPEFFDGYGPFDGIKETCGKVANACLFLYNGAAKSHRDRKLISQICYPTGCLLSWMLQEQQLHSAQMVFLFYQYLPEWPSSKRSYCLRRIFRRRTYPQLY